MSTHVDTRTDRRRTVLIAAAAVTAGLVGSAALIWHASYSAFSAQTSSPSNNWSTGTVKLAGDNAGAAAFTATNLKPGAKDEKCLTVTSSGSLDSVVKLYTKNGATTKGLANAISLTITQGDGGSFAGGCTDFKAQATDATVFSGTLADLESQASSYATGLRTWSPTGGDASSRTFKIAFEINPNISNDSQGGTANVDFVWESQNS